MLTKAQQAYIDDVFARAGKPTAALQLQIDEILATKTEDELTKLFLRDAEVVRPTIEAELLCAVMAAKKAELNPSMIGELENKTATKQPVVETPLFSSTTRQFRIIHIDDEECLLKLVGRVIRANQAFKGVIVQTFQNRDEALRELLQNDPDLLITDLRSDNVPGRTEHFGMSGFELLSLLAQRDVKYPILVFSGSLSQKDHESYARQCAGLKLNVSFLQKPANPEQLYLELSKHLGLDNTSAPRKVKIPDYREAKYWCEAAEKGDAESQYHLGISYENGFGVAGDEAEAIKWLRKAAEQGNADAQSYLGLKYLYGLGVLKNTDEGRKWLQKAADQGDEGAIKQLATKEMKPSATKGEPAKNTKTELQHGVKNAEVRMQKKGITVCQLFLIMGVILFFSGMGINAGGDTGTAIFLFILSVPCFIGFLKTIDKE